MASVRRLAAILAEATHPAGIESLSPTLRSYFLGVTEFVENRPEKMDLATYHVGPCHPRCRHALKPRCTGTLEFTEIPQTCGCGGKGHSEAIRATNHAIEEYKEEEQTSSLLLECPLVA